MTWRSTIKAKAREYVVRHYPLGSNKSCEENLANAQELIRGAMFVRDGVEPDVCSLHFALPWSVIYFAGYHKKHGVSSSGWPHSRIFLHRNLCACRSLSRSFHTGSPQVCCLPCSNSCEYQFFTCFHTDAIFHSCELLSTSIRSQESDKTAHSSTISIPKFLCSLWVCKPKLTPIASTPQWLGRLEFAGQLLGGESSPCILIIFLDSFCNVSSMDGDNMTAGEDDFDVILDWGWRVHWLFVLFLLLCIPLMRSCEMLWIVLRVCAVWDLCAVNECNMNSQCCQASCYTVLGREVVGLDIPSKLCNSSYLAVESVVLYKSV